MSRERMREISTPGPADYRPLDFVFKIARTRAETDGFWELRREVFCREQAIFDESDRDEYDATMIPIVAMSLLMGMEDEVVGVVRIEEREPGVWWGSRLGVRRDHRRLSYISPGVSARDRQPANYAQKSIGAGLIYKAVSTAAALGCHKFLAHVQWQNANFFQRLHWAPLGEIELFGLRHVKMEADLNFYPPAEHDIVPSRAA